MTGPAGPGDPEYGYEVIREALRRHLNALAAQQDMAAYQANPLTPEELSLVGAEQWAPAEGWSDWADAAG